MNNAQSPARNSVNHASLRSLRMPIAPEVLLMSFSLKQVTDIVIGWHDNAVMTEDEVNVSSECMTVRPAV